MSDKLIRAIDSVEARMPATAAVLREEWADATARITALVEALGEKDATIAALVGALGDFVHCPERFGERCEEVDKHMGQAVILLADLPAAAQALEEDARKWRWLQERWPEMDVIEIDAAVDGK